MQFHEYQSVRNHAIDSGMFTREAIDRYLAGAEELKTAKASKSLSTATLQEVLQFIGAILAVEQIWVNAGRPYYNIWPGMLEPLLGIPLEKIDATKLRLPLNSLVLRFPSTYDQLQTVLVHQACNATTGLPEAWGLHITVDKLGSGYFPTMQFRYTLSEKFPTYDEFKALNEISEDRFRRSIDPTAAAYDALKILAAIAMLGDNPDVIVPKPLSKDEALYEQTANPELIEKAKRKGCFQFDVGKNIIVQPGVRRPHFAIRHMGKVPNLVPTLRPIKGCIVQRKLATTVPTGFMDDEEE